MKMFSTIVIVLFVILAIIYVVYLYISPTFTADIDGQVFEGDRGGAASYTSGKVQIGAQYIDPDTTHLIILLNATKVGTYLLNDDNAETGNFGAYYIGNKVFASTSRFTGSVTITRLDLEKKKISGTFEFRAVQVVPPGSKVINITNGVFKDVPIAN
jgi:hypothetical protein